MKIIDADKRSLDAAGSDSEVLDIGQTCNVRRRMCPRNRDGDASDYKHEDALINHVNQFLEEAQ